MGVVSYSASDSDIEQAELSYTEWETDLHIEIQNAESTYTGYDEYRYNIGSIGHSPHELMAFLTAVYQDFTYVNIQSVLQAIFNEQYSLDYVPITEIKTRMVTKTGTTTDDEGNEIEYEYEELEEYEWYVLKVNLSSISFSEIIAPKMSDDEKSHYSVLAQTYGGRQYGGSPFSVMSWLPFVTSSYGYRIHPITGVKDLHRGIDIAMPEGTEIRAGISGKVTTSEYDGSYGNYITIKSDDGIEMKYAHCHSLYYSVGQTVQKGDAIAAVGNTGSSTGAHLHMEILKDGSYLNPAYFIETYYQQ